MKALVLLGCPETPSQTPLSIYATHKLTQMGYDVTIAANPAAKKLVMVSDPENHYINKLTDLEKLLGEVSPGDYDLLLGFVHKDAAASFFITFYHLLNTKSIALVFERDMDLVEEYTNMVTESTDATVVSVRAFHNPTPIKVRLDKALKELE